MRSARIALVVASAAVVFTGCAAQPQTPEDRFYSDFEAALGAGGWAAPTPSDQDRREALVGAAGGWCEASSTLPRQMAEGIFVGGMQSMQSWDEGAVRALIEAADEHICETYGE